MLINFLSQIHRLVQQLPSPNQRMLEILLSHLANVVEKSDKNLMTVSNLGVCFGPTLFRAEEETVAAIMDIKFTNVVVEIMITHWESLLKTKPDTRPPPKPAHTGSTPTQVLPSFISGSRYFISIVGSSNSITGNSPGGCVTSSCISSPLYSATTTIAQLASHTCAGTSSFLCSLLSNVNVIHPSQMQTVIFDGPKVQAVGSAHSGSTLPGPPHNGPTYATWERTLRGAPPPAPPPQVCHKVSPYFPNWVTFQATQSHRGSVSSSLSNLSSVSSMSTPTAQPWYRASQPRIASARASHLSEKLGHSTGEKSENMNAGEYFA